MGSERRLLSIISLIGAAAATAPTFTELPPVLRLFLLAGLAGGMLADWRGLRLPPLALTIIALFGTITALTQFTWLNPVSSFLAIAVVLLVIRLLTEKNRRNYLQLFSLAVFIVAASSLIRLDALFFVAMVTLLTSGMLALVILTALELPATAPCPPAVTNRLVMAGLLLTVAALPLLILFFFILPRTQMPLWHFMPESSTSSGFSEQVAPGKSSTQPVSRRVAFRAEVPVELPMEQLYWRATVLNHLTASTWVRRPPDHNNESKRGGSQAEIVQTIYLEPGLARFLVSIDLPLNITGIRFLAAPDAVITSNLAGSSRLRYQVTSRLQARLIPPRNLDIAPYLDLTAAKAPQLVELGHGMQQRYPDPEMRLQQIKALFQAKQLRYATSGMPTSPTPVDDFFFKVRQGNCEFFASAGAILLRAAGIPTRLVGGYYGGDYQKLGSFYTVTDERAHVWIEALMDGYWQRIDPSRWAVNSSEVGHSPQRSLARQLLAYLDIIDYYWTRAVVTYDFQQQLAALDKTGATVAKLLQPGNLRRTALWLAMAIAAVASVVLARNIRIPTREERLLRIFCRRLNLRELPPSTCLLDIARGIDDRRLRRALRLYAATLYHDRRISPTRYRRIRKLLVA